MIKILLDTNAFQDNWLAQGEAFTLIADFVAKHRARVYVSEISVLEHVRHYEKHAPVLAERVKESILRLSRMLPHRWSPDIPPVSEPHVFEAEFRRRLEEIGIEMIPVPAIPVETLVHRDLGQVRPFDSAGKSFRDTLIWIGFLNVLDRTVTKAVCVTSNSADFCDADKSSLHPSLADEVTQKEVTSVDHYETPRALVEGLIRPILRAEAEQVERAKDVLCRLGSDRYEPFRLIDVVATGLESFESRSPDGTFFVSDVPLEEPLWVSFLEDPARAEVDSIVILKAGSFVCEGTSEAKATVQGYLEKHEAFILSDEGRLFISTPNWNEHYSEVEVVNVPVTIRFSFEFDWGSTEIRDFEVTRIESRD